MKSPELKWGLLMGGAYLIWLYASYFLGMHTNGLLWIQLSGIFSILLTFVGFVFALREVKRKSPEISWAEGVKSGGIIAGIVAIFAVVAQGTYFSFLHPEFPTVIAEEFRPQFVSQGLAEKDIEEAMEAAKISFGRNANMVKAGVGMFLSGIVFSMVIMAFLRRLAK